MAVQDLAARTWFTLSLLLGRMLRGARYSAPPVAEGDQVVRKHRRFYAPVLIWLSQPLVTILNTGVKVLPQQEWEDRERHIYERLHGATVGVAADGALLLPRLPGQTLASLLDDPKVEHAARRLAIEAAVVALARFHARGFTHGDAMAENVLVEVARSGSYVARPVPQGRDSCVANWFDFETLHDPDRPVAWQRADDLRALLVTCLLRTAPDQHAETIELILNAYADDNVTRILASSFTSVWRRSLPFHLAQAPMTFEEFRQVGRLLTSHLFP